MRASELSLYGRRLWEAMSSHWPTGDQQRYPGGDRVRASLAGHAEGGVLIDDRQGRLEHPPGDLGDAVAEITRLKAEDGGPVDIGGATLAGAAMRAGLIDEYTIVTHPVLVGGGTPFFTALDNWVNLSLVETRTFPGGVVMTRYETGLMREPFPGPSLRSTMRTCPITASRAGSAMVCRWRRIR
ncbi:dihydrofolate reductase family protein [Nonomuraea sp. KM90]|uniref:dihydrofolate reductase family protein n=1 Tax=Nonomuraea sp. KM90 TaxID=3457428 RepID=UPI003FCDC695